MPSGLEKRIFKAQCEYCSYHVTADSFQEACNELIDHLQKNHTDELHEIYDHALNRAVVQAISCVA